MNGSVENSDEFRAESDFDCDVSGVGVLEFYSVYLISIYSARPSISFIRLACNYY